MNSVSSVSSVSDVTRESDGPATLRIFASARLRRGKDAKPRKSTCPCRQWAVFGKDRRGRYHCPDSFRIELRPCPTRRTSICRTQGGDTR